MATGWSCYCFIRTGLDWPDDGEERRVVLNKKSTPVDIKEKKKREEEETLLLARTHSPRHFIYQLIMWLAFCQMSFPGVPVQRNWRFHWTNKRRVGASG